MGSVYSASQDPNREARLTEFVLSAEQSRGCGEEIIETVIETVATCRQWESIFSIFSMRRQKGLRGGEGCGIGDIYRLYSSLGAMACVETS